MLIRLLATVLCVSVLVACGGDTVQVGEPTPTGSGAGQLGGTPDPTTPPQPQPTAVGTQIVSADSEFGSILFDSTGQAIYLFDVETTNQPACFDACAQAWPPVLTETVPVAGVGLQAALLATTQRSDGSLQVTYGGHPLYSYAHEGKHEVKCHDVFMNGGTWYAVQPDGSPAPHA